MTRIIKISDHFLTTLSHMVRRCSNTIYNESSAYKYEQEIGMWPSGTRTRVHRARPSHLSHARMQLSAVNHDCIATQSTRPLDKTVGNQSNNKLYYVDRVTTRGIIYPEMPYRLRWGGRMEIEARV